MSSTYGIIGGVVALVVIVVLVFAFWKKVWFTAYKQDKHDSWHGNQHQIVAGDHAKISTSLVCDPTGNVSLTVNTYISSLARILNH